MKPKEKIRRWGQALIHAAIVAGLILMLWLSLLPSLQVNSVQQVSYSEFLRAVRESRVQVVHISSAEIRGVLRPEQGKAKSVQPHILSAVRPPDLYDPELLPLLRDKECRGGGQARYSELVALTAGFCVPHARPNRLLGLGHTEDGPWR